MVELRILDRSVVAQAARDNKMSPSTGAHLDTLRRTQKMIRLDATYNSRPPSLEPPPISIYHPVFGQFTRLMAESHENLDFTQEELEHAMKFILASLPFYDTEVERKDEIRALKIVHGHILMGAPMASGSANPDGCVYIVLKQFDDIAIPILILELKNEIGTGDSDPMSQSECCYVKINGKMEVCHISVF